MPEVLRLIMAGGLSLLITAAACPYAIRIAGHLDMYDRPVGWKSHGAPTPYLGGAAVVLGFGLPAVFVSGGGSDFAPVVGGAVLLWMVGTLDDHSSLGPALRIASETGAALLLWASGLGWDVFSSEAANLTLTVVWVLGLVNGMNLLDLMDGVAGAVAAACAVGIGLYAVAHESVLLGALSFSLAGACVGFLPYNLASPTKVFLGDGGSMPIGFVLAAATMDLPTRDALGAAAILPAIVLFGVPFFDLAHRVNSRLQRSVSLLTPGPDSVANLLRTHVSSRHSVPLALAGVQCFLASIIIGAAEISQDAVLVAAILCLVAGAVLVAVLNTHEDRTSEDRPVGSNGEASEIPDGSPRQRVKAGRGSTP